MTRKVVIAGGGIMGCATAYYLTKLAPAEVEVTVVECHEIAGHASGKAGGFLAMKWCDGGPVESLARKSFALHEELARDLPDDVGFRKLDTWSLTVSQGRAQGQTDIPPWVDGTVLRKGNLGQPDNTAQVHPELLTQALMRAAEAQGAKVIKGKVVGVQVEANRVQTVQIEGMDDLPADAVVVTMGPWSGQATKWFPRAKIGRITGSRAHSIVLDTSKHEITPHALFLDLDGQDPEIYPRPDGTIYMCGKSDQASLPDDPALVSPDPKAIDSLVHMAGVVSSALADSPLVKSQACYLPCAGRGTPLIGPLIPYEGAYIATGHTCWGILNGPATGLALAETILRGQSESVSLKNFLPG